MFCCLSILASISLSLTKIVGSAPIICATLILSPAFCDASCEEVLSPTDQTLPFESIYSECAPFLDDDAPIASVAVVPSFFANSEYGTIEVELSSEPFAS